MRSFAALALILAVASCEKSSKDDKANTTDKVVEDPEAAPAQQGVGTDQGEVKSPVVAAVTNMTGEATCDALITAMRCSWSKNAGVPDSTKKMFEEGIEAWKLGLADAGARQMVIDACKMSLEAGHDGFAQVGCVDAGATGTAVAVAPAAGDTFTTGSVECDELIAHTWCSYGKAGAAMPDDAKKAFHESVAIWIEALRNDDTRQPTIDACKMSLDAAKDGFAAQGCGDPDYHADLARFDSGATAPPPPPAPAGALPNVGGASEPTCDELITRTMCAYKAAGSAMPADAVKAFTDSVDAWKEALNNPATRQATIDACKMSLDAAKDGFKAMGC